MGKKAKKLDYFEASQLVILVYYTILSVMLIAESFLLGWEKWALILVAAGVVVSWGIHIRQKLPVNTRIWIYASLMMATMFFYGSHVTSTFDVGLVMSVLILIFISTGIRGLITLAQITYYITIAYDIYQMVMLRENFDSLVISRTIMHIIVVSVICDIARGIIKKWISIMNRSEQEKDALAEAAERLNDFLANISHEIRTPINAVIGLTGVCIEKEKDEEIKNDLISVSSAGMRVGEQISDILDYSEIDMDALATNNEDYMLSSLINDILNQILSQREIDVELVIDVDPSIPEVMNTDVSKLKKIIRHLIDNGIKYTKEGGVYVHFSAEKRIYGINLRIEVTDTGIGIGKREMERVLDRFYQADSGRTRSTSGLGLGLSIVNGFTKKLKGFLTIESEPGQGTSVCVSIPQMIIDESSCMSLRDPGRLRLGAYLHFEKFDNPHVREFYNAMVRDLVVGLGVTMQRADNMEAFKKLEKETHFTHVFVGKEEYEEDIEFMEELAKTAIVAVVADGSFVPKEGSRVRIVPKPFYCFPVISILNTDVGQLEEEEGRLYTKGVRALVVDDEPMNHIVAKGIFTRYGMVVSSVNSGFEAIDYIRANDVDIIFMDHMMPGMDGVEAMKRIRSVYGKDRKDVPIVALTANAVSTAREMFLREGFDGFVAKPIELSELERVLKKVLPKSMLTIEKKDGTIVQIDTFDEGLNDYGEISGNTGEDVLESASGADSTGNETPEEIFYKELEELGVDTKAGLRYCQNDKDFYLQILTQFGSDAEKKRKDTEKYLESNDYENYEIIVHSIKGTAKMIGNMHLSDEAKQLEYAAKAGDGDKIGLMHDKTMDEYEGIAKVILRYIGKNEQTENEIKDSVNDEAGGKEKASDPSEDEIMEFGPEGGDEQ